VSAATSGAAPRFGEATIEDCAREPIHTPGSVQPHAAVLVVDGDGLVVQASGNVGGLLGLDGEVLGRPLSNVVGEPTAARLTELDPGEGLRAHSTRLRVGSVEADVVRTVVAGVSVFECEPVAGAEDGAASFEEAVTTAVTRIQNVREPARIVEQVCGLVAELTGFDRVMGYRFEPDDHGVVIAERRAEHLESFLGLHYPASDIPPQARRLYLRQWIRLIPDVAYAPVPLRPELLPTTGALLDMSEVGSRAVSPIHCEYLQNMGVRASMSISLVVEGRLWGLIACHHYGGPWRPSVPVRQACEFVALAASVMLGARLSEQRTTDALGVEQSLNRLAELLLAEDDLATGLLTDPTLLTGMLDADGVAVLLGGRTATAGAVPDQPTLAALVETLAHTRPGEVVATDRAPERFPVVAAAVDVAAGFVAMPLSSLQRNYVIWFRRRWSHEVRWGGNPEKAVRRAHDGSMRLVPRASFAEWVESVEDRSRPWQAERTAAVEQLRGLLARHISRTAEHLARLNAELVRSNAELDAFAYVAAHDLKEPLRGLANYASFLAEDYHDVLDDEGRHQLTMMMQLTGRMNGLLTSLLNYARVGRSELNRETTRLSTILAGVAELLRTRLDQSGAQLVQLDDTEIHADVELVGQVLMNLVSNAVKYADSAPRIEVGVTTLSRTGRGPDAVRRSPLDDVDTPVVLVRDNGIGIPADRHEDIFRVFRRLHGPGAYGGGEGAGLTIARRIVERHGGTMWVESTPGAGSTFYFTLGAS
jgi:light-regulated signal transduction histidine kinase (bacteriophytochrome)